MMVAVTVTAKRKVFSAPQVPARSCSSARGPKTSRAPSMEQAMSLANPAWAAVNTAAPGVVLRMIKAKASCNTIPLATVRQGKRFRSRDRAQASATNTAMPRRLISLGCMAGGSGRDGLFPNGHEALHFINQELAGGERFFAMGRDHFHPEGGFVDRDQADTVYQPDGFDGPALFNGLEDQFELALGHELVGLVV